MHPLAPLLALAGAVLAISFSSVLIRYSQAPSAVIAFYRMALTTLLLLPWARRDAGRVRRLPPRLLWASVLSGVLLAGHFLTWIASLRYTSVTASVLLVTSHPLYVMAADAWLLRERVPARRLLGALLALTGVAVVTFAGAGAGDLAAGGTALYGNFLAVAGSWFFAGYILIGRRVRQVLPVMPYTTLVYGVASLVIAAGLALTGTPFGPYPWREMLLFVALAVVPTLGGHTVLNWALEWVPASVVSVSILGEPVGASLLAWLLLGEAPSGVELAGGALTLAGLFVATQTAGRETERLRGAAGAAGTAGSAGAGAAAGAAAVEPGPGKRL
ncbi:DMT family transporter [Thermaerobacter sp. PB12/4term]|uniref:DMT family transporter n=1 Tax=Thermaerobacter sp. PB12/4term TaxID=2293838 RepID=UPI00210F79A6|nr:DMT family transporter [Thermaerobacter sp. PB12/4term]